MEYQNIVRRHFSDVITITSLKNVTKITSQKFFQFGPLPIKISACASGLGLGLTGLDLVT